MTTHRLISTAEELDEAILAAAQANDSLILRDRRGTAWEFGPEHYELAPTQGWGTFTEPAAYPFLVLWWPGSVILPIPVERPVSIETDVT